MLQSLSRSLLLFHALINEIDVLYNGLQSLSRSLLLFHTAIPATSMATIIRFQSLSRSLLLFHQDVACEPG